MRAKIAGGRLLTAPANPKDLGWWSCSTGVLVVDGHIGVNHVAGSLAGIERLSRGAKLVLQTSDRRRLNYSVVAENSVGKGQLSAEYFLPKYNGYLLLLTCGGSFDRKTGHYRNNTVVLAQPA